MPAISLPKGGGAIRGIGPSTASLLWTHFKEKVFDVLDDEPQRLRELPGIGPKRASMIAESWQAQRSMRELLMFLADSGIGPERAARIQKQYGPDAVRLIRENPYRLVRDVRGIGFTSADQLALKLGLAADSPYRIQAGVRHALDEAALQGHCGLPHEELTAETVRLLHVPAELVAQAILVELEQRHLARNTIEGVDAVFTPRLYVAEREIAGGVAARGTSVFGGDSFIGRCRRTLGDLTSRRRTEETSDGDRPKPANRKEHGDNPRTKQKRTQTSRDGGL